MDYSFEILISIILLESIVALGLYISDKISSMIYKKQKRLEEFIKTVIIDPVIEEDGDK